jgi:hypothetical protein
MPRDFDSVSANVVHKTISCHTQDGPWELVLVGFCIDNRVFWTGAFCSEKDAALAEEIVKRWNAPNGAERKDT